jgi:hypothetical protein
MRKAAGIILIVLGIFQIVCMVMAWHPSMLPWSVRFGFFSYGILIIPLLVTGGILCLKKKYWEVCLTLALLAFVMWILSLVKGESIYWHVVLPSLATWRNWLGIGAMLISTIFIVGRKKEWSNISA